MGSIFKPNPSAKKFRIAYTDERGRRRTCQGFADKKATLEKLRQLEIRRDRIAAGLPVEGEGAELGRKVEDALCSWAAELRRIGRTAVYIDSNVWTLTRVFAACKWRTLADVRADSLSAYLSRIAEEGRSPGTINLRRDKASSFACYCVRQGWFTANPLAKVRRSRIHFRPRRRRAITIDELNRLLNSPWKRKQNRPVFAVAALSGLRRAELARLEKRDVVFEPSPQFRLRAEATKSKRAETLPMLPECAEALRPLWDAAATPTTRLFTFIPDNLATDNAYRRAGIVKRVDGRQADFHALRYTFCTLLARTLPIQVVSRLMRHRDIRLTVGLYYDLGIAELTENVGQLPRLLSAHPGAHPHGEAVPKSLPA